VLLQQLLVLLVGLMKAVTQKIRMRVGVLVIVIVIVVFQELEAFVDLPEWLEGKAKHYLPLFYYQMATNCWIWVVRLVRLVVRWGWNQMATKKTLPVCF
jgi:hypothetical protein